jgi:hypothetical protein
MLDVSVHADRAAVDHAADARAAGGVDQLTDGGGVDLLIDAVRQPRLPVEGGDVVDDVEASLERPAERWRRGEIAVDQRDAVPLEIRRRPGATGAGRRADEGADGVATAFQAAR